jgi:hypothetical protein
VSGFFVDYFRKETTLCKVLGEVVDGELHHRTTLYPASTPEPRAHMQCHHCLGHLVSSAWNAENNEKQSSGDLQSASNLVLSPTGQTG